MQLLYFGTLCSDDSFNKIVAASKIKPSAAPNTFETQLMDALSQYSDLNIHAFTFPIVASFPNSSILGWKKKKEKINNQINTTWLPALNFHVLKYISLSLATKKVLSNWLTTYSTIDDKCVLIYSIYLPVAKQIVKQCKSNKCKCIVIVPDLPKHMYLDNDKSYVRMLYSKLYVAKTRKIQYQFDGYILFTKYMISELLCYNNFLLVEGIINPKCFIEFENIPKHSKKAIMYAGALHKRNGIEILALTFMTIMGDYELWLFGDGDCTKDAIEWEKKDNRIKYFGSVDRKSVLEYEKRASLLVNFRLQNDEYTKYSFPSKTMEYMASGTPLLMTRILGVPDEYYRYMYVLENLNDLEKMLYSILLKTELELNDFGNKAKQFILINKSSTIQAKKIYDFLVKILQKQ